MYFDASNLVTFPKLDLPSTQAWKKSSWPIPHPLMTPRPVTTTRRLSSVEDEEDEYMAVRELRCVFVEEENWVVFIEEEESDPGENEYTWDSALVRNIVV